MKDALYVLSDSGSGNLAAIKLLPGVETVMLTPSSSPAILGTTPLTVSVSPASRELLLTFAVSPPSLPLLPPDPPDPPDDELVTVKVSSTSSPLYSTVTVYSPT